MGQQRHIGELIEDLKRRLVETRNYSSKPGTRVNFPFHEFDLYPVIDPKVKRFKPKVNKEWTAMEVVDMAIMRRGGQEELAKQWGLRLPADYIAFCEAFDYYLLSMRNPISILDAGRIESQTTWKRRYYWHIPRSLPHRLFTFAQSVPTHGPLLPEERCEDFSFRWKPNREAPEVVHSNFARISEEVLLGPGGDEFVTDESFTAWLQRMIETDGYPLVPGRTEPGNGGTIRVK